jgi:GR25 family glycosyltransferase involved in LPS biosynthesis
MDSSIQIIIICCNEERRKFQKKQMEDLNLPYVFFDAYTPKTVGDYITEKHKEHPEKDTVICCNRSHIDAIDLFVKKYQSKEYCIIMEDDVVVINTFLDEVQKIITLWGSLAAPNPIDLISLGYLPPGTKYKDCQSDGVLHWGTEDAIWGTQCYMINRKCAKDMAETLVHKNTTDLYNVLKNKKMYANKVLRLQSDVIITGYWKQGFIWPLIATEKNEFNSLIFPEYKLKRYERSPYNQECISRNAEFYKPIHLANSIPQPYVINLQHRKDRWLETQEEFKKLDLIPRRIEAVYVKDKGFKGCLASHILALKEGQKTNLPVWISEDDIAFIVPKSKLFYLIDEFLKSDGEILCIANNTLSVSHHDKLFYVALETQTTASYIIKPSFIPILLQLWEEVYECEEKGTVHFSYHLFKRTGGKGIENFNCLDVCWKILQHYYKFLVPIQVYAIQRKSYSDITQSVQDYYSQINNTK